MFQKLVIVSYLLLYAQALAAQPPADSLITQTIVYKTGKAGEVYLVWAVNNWQQPENRHIPANSTVEKKMAWTKMIRKRDEFSMTLSLPAGTSLNYMFWVPVDASGDSTDGWDTYGDIFYSSTFAGNRVVEVKDDALWMPESKHRFELLKGGKYVLLFTISGCLLLVLPFLRRLSFSRTSFLTGILTGAALLMALIRMQMNHLWYQKRLWTPGAMFQDLLLLAVIGACCYGLLFLVRRRRWLSIAVSVFFSLIVLSFCLYGILNIEIVRQLGRPLNYQWLYYSDFMNGTDAKNAMSYNFSAGLLLNVSLLLCCVILVSFCFSLLPRTVMRKVNRAVLLVAILILITGFAERRSYSYEEKNVTNPVAELLSSAYTANVKPRLFSMPVSDEARRYMEAIHSGPADVPPDAGAAIDNIVLFVMESTPSNLVSVYNDSIKATPNLRKWAHMATRYNNMYAHIPSTPNSMLSMVAGIYPMLSYRSLLQEDGSKNLVTLPNELRMKGWANSFFSAADLSFGKMDSFALSGGFGTVADSKTIECAHKQFAVTNSSLDGLDDRCIVNGYLRWMDEHSTHRGRFAMLWTNQTHYPYFFDRDKEVYYSSNTELNHYLNALRCSDEAFGELMEGLAARSMLARTLVIVVGDHGEAFGTHHQYSHASHVYEENVHIPTILYNPVLCHGASDDRIFGMIDIAPTIASIAGVKKPAVWQGHSLLSNSERKQAFFICPYSDFLFGVRDGRWKYIYNASRNVDELYDLENDPGELKNVAAENRDVVRKNYELIGAWIQFHNRKLEGIAKP